MMPPLVSTQADLPWAQPLASTDAFVQVSTYKDMNVAETDL